MKIQSQWVVMPGNKQTNKQQVTVHLVITDGAENFVSARSKTLPALSSSKSRLKAE
jgi:hypothetical protein